MGINLSPEMGEKVDLVKDDSPYYRTRIDGMTDDTLHVPLPTYQCLPFVLHPEEEILLYFYRDTGRYAIKVRVDEVSLTGNIHGITLTPLAPAQRQQRRHAYRFELRTQATLYRLTEDGKAPPSDKEYLLERTFTRDISELGVCLQVKGDYEPGERFLAEIHLLWPKPNSPPLRLITEVRRRDQRDPEQRKMLIGCSFVNVNNRTYDNLSRYAMDMQRRQLQNRKQLV
jgi:c-di-GMP-binding flagellar brake protein YcgR